MPLSGQIGIHAQVSQAPTGYAGLGTPAVAVSYLKNWDIASGTGANQADNLFTASQRSVAGAANDDLDLAGVLAGAFGTATFVKVKAVLIEALATNTTNLTIGNATANQFQGWFGAVAHTIVLKPGDFFLIASPGAAGWGVTAGTADLLRVANAAGAAALYNLTVIGTTA